jgi:hypothetical protein
VLAIRACGGTDSFSGDLAWWLIAFLKCLYKNPSLECNQKSFFKGTLGIVVNCYLNGYVAVAAQGTGNSVLS